MIYTESEQLLDYQTHETWSEKVESITKMIKTSLSDKREFIHDGRKYDSIYLIVDGGYLDEYPWNIRLNAGLFSDRSYHLVIRKRS